MNSKNVMIASSITTGLLGIAVSFFPQEILSRAGISPSEIQTLFVQIDGALYIGFATMNWMAKTVLIGGIYARPLAIGNFAHFMIGAITLIKAAINNSALSYLWVIASVYSLFAILFSYILFTNPSKKN